MRRVWLWCALGLAACSGTVGPLEREDAGVFDGADDGGGAPAVDAGHDGGSAPALDGGAHASVDAGGVDAGGIDAGTGCAGKTWKLCEDFEGAADGALPSGWTKLSGWGPGTLEVSSGSAHSGTKALHGSSASSGQPRAVHSLAALGATAGTHWGRVYYRMDTPAPNAAGSGAYFHVTWVGLRASGESRVVDTVESPSGTVQYLYNLPDDSCCRGSSYSWRYDGAWHCAEWYVDDVTDSYRFFIDNQEVTSLAFTGNANARLAVFQAIALGPTYYVDSTGLLSGWLDDLAIDDTRIGCGP